MTHALPKYILLSGNKTGKHPGFVPPRTTVHISCLSGHVTLIQRQIAPLGQSSVKSSGLSQRLKQLPQQSDRYATVIIIKIHQHRSWSPSLLVPARWSEYPAALFNLKYACIHTSLRGCFINAIVCAPLRLFPIIFRSSILSSISLCLKMRPCHGSLLLCCRCGRNVNKDMECGGWVCEEGRVSESVAVSEKPLTQQGSLLA